VDITKTQPTTTYFPRSVGTMSSPVATQYGMVATKTLATTITLHRSASTIYSIA
jgi:hypothetical protein